jgi:hypothetical protein
MSQEHDCKMPEPTPDHLRLQEAVGIWDIKAKHFMEPGKPPMGATAVETVTPVGPFWVAARYESSFMGMPFTGQCIMGFDPGKDQHVLIWADSMSPHLFHFTGAMDKSGKVLHMSAKGPSMMGPGLVDWRSEMHYTDKDHMVFKMFMMTPQGECQLLENHYTRRK